MKLDQLQTDFIASIFNDDRESAIAYVKGDQRLDASQRLGIYRGSVHGILTQSLGDTYPVCKALLGEEFFDKMCDRFIDKYPPTTAFFSHYGDDLSLFLNGFEPVKTIPFIPDVAAFEWSRHTLWQRIASDPLDFSQIETLNEQQQASIVFKLRSTMHLFESDYRIDDIWFAHQPDSNIELESIDIQTEIRLLMWKGDDAIKAINLESNDLVEASSFTERDYWSFLKAISAQKNITELANQFDKKFPELLNKSIQEGWIGSFTCN